MNTMMMFGGFMFPFLALIVWLVVVVYAITLGTRLVNAVEQIARSLAQRPPDVPRS